MFDDKNIGVNNKNKIIDNIKSNKKFKSRNDNNVSTKLNNNINEDKNNYIENLNHYMKIKIMLKKRHLTFSQITKIEF